MKTTLLLISLAILPFFVQSQFFPACDSVQIECCSFNTIGSETISIQVANQSTYLFPYPGFILFNLDNDTVAIETVNYFGIGTFPQAHTLDIISPFDLPFEGNLKLYSGFFDEYNCTFPLMIEDSVQTGIPEISPEILTVYPNPATTSIYLEFNYPIVDNDITLNVINSFGNTVLTKAIKVEKIQLQTRDIGNSGMYFIHIIDQDGRLLSTQKIILQN